MAPLVRTVLVAVGVGCLGLRTDQLSRADDTPAPPPAVSTFAPAEDLIAQAASYATSLEKSLESPDKFNSSRTQVARDASTLAVVAVALALHDSSHPLKGSAAALLTAAQQLASTEDHTTAQTALAAVQQALRGEGTSSETPSWKVVAGLDPLMKQVTLSFNKLRRSTRPGPRFATQAAENARLAAVLAVIAQGIQPDTHEVADAAQHPAWYDFCAQMRDACGELNGALHRQDVEATAAAMQRAEKSCKDCHEKFRIEE